MHTHNCTTKVLHYCTYYAESEIIIMPVNNRMDCDIEYNNNYGY